MDAHGLTPREQEVVALMLQGCANAEIAARLALSPWTAQDHARNVFRKLGVEGRQGLVARVFADLHLPRALAGGGVDADGALVAGPPAARAAP